MKEDTDLRGHHVIHAYQLLNWLTTFLEIWCEHCAIGSLPILILLWFVFTVNENIADVWTCEIGQLKLYRVIQNDCRGFNNLSYTIHL